MRSKAEILAKALVLQDSAIRAEQILSLFDALPQDRNDRNEQGFSFSSGAFVRIKVGLRKSCKSFPWAIQAINKFARVVVPSGFWTSFAILERDQTSEHIDAANAMLPSYLIPLSSFQGGQLRVQSPSGVVHLDVAKGPVTFCARQHMHSSCPFRGRRVVLALFSLQGAVHLSHDDRSSLQALAFPIPSNEQFQLSEAIQPSQLGLEKSVEALLPRQYVASSTTEGFVPSGCASLSVPGPAEDLLPNCTAPSATKDSAPSGSNTLSVQGPDGGQSPNSKRPRLLPEPQPQRQAPLLVELCAGSAILSSTAQAYGWDSVPIDQASCRFAPTRL